MKRIILYGTPFCGMVPPVRRVLEQAGAEYEYVDISQDAEARRRVREINRGNESVPTLEFVDGTTCTEPSLAELQAQLAALGYRAKPPGWLGRVTSALVRPIVPLVGGVLLIVGILVGYTALTTLGVVLVILGLLGRWLTGRNWPGR